MRSTQRRTELHARLRAWHRRHRRTFPWRETRDPYHVLVAEILLKQTGYWKARAVYEQILELAPTPRELARLHPERLRPIIRPLGLRARAETLVRIGQALVRDHGGRVPDSERELLALPGVGRYIANAVLVFAYLRPAPLVDGMTGRFYRRLLGLDSSRPPYADRALWETVRAVQPRRARWFHLAVIDFTSAVCRFRKPRCSECPLKELCAYRRDIRTQVGTA